MRRTVLGLAMILGVLAPGPIGRAQDDAPVALLVEATVPVGGYAIEYAFGSLWMMSEGRLLRIDPAGGDIISIEVPGGDLALADAERFRGITAGEGAVWLADTALSMVHKIDPATNALVLSVPTDIFGSAGSIGVGEGSIWVVTFADRDRSLTRYDAETGEEQARIALPEAGRSVLVAEGSVWVTAANRPSFYRIDPAEDAVATSVETVMPAHLLAAGEGAIWAVMDDEGIVQRIDPASGRIVATIVGGATDMESDGDAVVGGGQLWIITRNSIVTRIDPTTNAVTGIFVPPTGTVIGRRIRFAEGSLFVSGSSVFRIAQPD